MKGSTEINRLSGSWVCLQSHLSGSLGAGRKTFPRARRTQGHGFRSPMSFSPTDQSPSTSSGSSIFSPELEEPGRRRRGSDIEPIPSTNPTLSVMDISPPSRCKFGKKSRNCKFPGERNAFYFFFYIRSSADLMQIQTRQVKFVCFLCVYSAPCPNKLAPGKAAGSGRIRSGLPLLRCWHGQRTRRQTGPVRPRQPGNQQGYRWARSQTLCNAVFLLKYEGLA